MLIVGTGVKPMIYIDKFGVLQMGDESDNIPEETIELIGWKSVS